MPHLESKNSSSDSVFGQFKLSLEEVEKATRTAKVKVPDVLFDETRNVLTMLEDENSIDGYESLLALVEIINDLLHKIGDYYSNNVDEWNEGGFTMPSTISSLLFSSFYVIARRALEKNPNFSGKEKAKIFLVKIEDRYKWFKRKESENRRKLSEKKEGKKGEESRKRKSFSGVMLMPTADYDSMESGGNSSPEKIDAEKIKLRVSAVLNELAEETENIKYEFKKNRYSLLKDYSDKKKIDLDGPRYFFLRSFAEKLNQIFDINALYKDKGGLEGMEITVDLKNKKLNVVWKKGEGISTQEIKNMISEILGMKTDDPLLNAIFKGIRKDYVLRPISKTDPDVASGDGADASNEDEKILQELDPLLVYDEKLDEKDGSVGKLKDLMSTKLYDFADSKLQDFGMETLPESFHLNPVQQMLVEIVHYNVLTPILANIHVSKNNLKSLTGGNIFETLGNVANIVPELGNVALSHFLGNLVNAVTDFLVTIQETQGDVLKSFYLTEAFLEIISGGEYVLDNTVLGDITSTLLLTRIKGQAMKWGFRKGADLEGVDLGSSIDWDRVTVVLSKIESVLSKFGDILNRSPSKAAALRNKEGKNIKNLKIVTRFFLELQDSPGLDGNSRIFISFILRTLTLTKDDYELASLCEEIRPTIKTIVSENREALFNILKIDPEYRKMFNLSLFVDSLLPATPQNLKEMPELAKKFFDGLRGVIVESKEKFSRPTYLALNLAVNNLENISMVPGKRNEFIMYGEHLYGLILKDKSLRDVLITNLSGNFNFPDEFKSAILKFNSDPKVCFGEIYDKIVKI